MSQRSNSVKSALHAAWSPLRLRWTQSSARERQVARVALALVALALVWFVALSPALRTLQTAKTQGPVLGAQLQSMLQLQAQAQAMQAQPNTSAVDARGLLSAALPTLGKSARMSVAGDRATVSLEGSTVDALTEWLVQVRLNAHARPLELHLSQRQGLWTGAIVLQVSGPSAP